MPRLKHPLSGTLYERLDDGNVLVGKGGKEGIFDRNGKWLSGERRTADPGLCIWVAYGFRPKVHQSKFLYDAAKTFREGETK